MLMKALLFLLAGAMISVARADKLDEISGLIRNYPILGWFFFISVLSLTGIPPLSGFIGKILIGEAAISGGFYVLMGIGFFLGLIVLYSLMRVFLNCLWGETLVVDEISGLISNYPILGWFFFISVLSLTGIPPLSGFIGKILIGEAAISGGFYVLMGIWFFSGLIVLYSLMRVFMNCFWGETLIDEE